MTLSDIIERNPHLGIFASLTGFAGSLLSFLHAASIVLGFAGACFGLAAGIYTWLIKRAHWRRIQQADKINEK